MNRSKLGGMACLSLIIGTLAIRPTTANESSNAADGNRLVSNFVPLQLAQGVIGQCRQTKRFERVYSQADLAAERVVDLPAGTEVTLADEVNKPAFGWIKISAPSSGFILTAFLVPCGTAARPTPAPQPAPQPAVKTCGIAQRDLAVKTEPSTLSAGTAGAITTRQGFVITGDTKTQTEPADQQGRVWAPIDRFGLTGWVAETGPGGVGTNIRRIACEAIGIP
ncbi:MAG: hypothetical protein F6K19_33160 [Cyanothece sp. SIO1E1]|nr:hypothetical protein [Cyanothece sp. SIO1E1]